MAKFDAVDRLMSLAMDAKTPAKGQAVGSANAEKVLEAQVSASERGIPPTTFGVQGGTATLAQPPVSTSDRGRQLLGALRPFLPAVGGALRLVDHGAAQTIARLLPLLGSFGSSTPTAAAGSPVTETSSVAQGGGKPGSLEALLLGLSHGQATVGEELKALQGRFSPQEEQLRRIRESQERLSAEQGSLLHLVHQLQDRSRLLTTGVVILLMLTIALGILMVLSFHR